MWPDEQTYSGRIMQHAVETTIRYLRPVGDTIRGTVSTDAEPGLTEHTNLMMAALGIPGHVLEDLHFGRIKARSGPAGDIHLAVPTVYDILREDVLGAG